MQLASWRREFLIRFPEYQAEAQAALTTGALMQKPLFFILKDAIDQGDTDIVEGVVSYVRWLDAHEPSACAVGLEEDLLGPITDSERLAAGLLSCLTENDFVQLRKYFVIGWQGPEQTGPKLRRLERQFKESRSPRRNAGAV